MHLYDHHSDADDDLAGSTEVVADVGSTSTLLTELMRERSISLQPVEATLLSLGVYTDTGSLTYNSTTPRDAAAIGWLLEQGANLSVVDRYIRSPLTDEQQAALGQGINAVRLERVGGVEVAIAGIRLERPLTGLAAITTQHLSLGGFPALFSIFDVGGKKVQVVGRARTAAIDVGLAMRAIGGGGHSAAGSATIKRGDPWDIMEQLLAALRTQTPSVKYVRDVMARDVKTLTRDTPLTEARDRLAEWSVTGAPVMRDDELIGVLSRRDIEGAEHGDRMHLTVASCMAHDLRTIDPGSTLETALRELVRYDVGRLPVLDGDALVGIITRSDILAVLYAA